MATLEEIYQKALTDADERLAFAQAASDPEALTKLLSERGCDATLEEAAAFLKEKLSATGELASEELAAVTGGTEGVISCVLFAFI